MQPNVMRQPRGEPQSEAARFSTSAARNCSAGLWLQTMLVDAGRNLLAPR